MNVSWIGACTLSHAHASGAALARIVDFLARDQFLREHGTLADTVGRHGAVQAFADGAIVGRVGDTARSILGIVEGAIVTWLASADGAIRPLHVLRPGRWIASQALISDRSRRVTLTASGDTTVFHLDEPSVETLIGSNPELWRWITRIVAGHLDNTLDVCAGLLTDRPLPRVAARLLALTKNGDDTDRGDGSIAVQLTQRDIAKLSGVSRNTVSRVLSELEARGLIARGYGRLRILDWGALSQVAREAS